MWLESAIITIGVILAIYQLSNSTTTIEANKNRASLDLITEYRKSISDFEIYPRNLKYSIYISSMQSEVELSAELNSADQTRLLTSIVALNQYYDRVYDCYQTEVCSQYLIEFTCENLNAFMDSYGEYNNEQYYEVLEKQRLVGKNKKLIDTLTYIEKSYLREIKRFCR